ncbi:MAG: hypothetical protein IJV87_02510 [Clostridia bacterium]|nr:hypothetical protein [Clostridia bacterium]
MKAKLDIENVTSFSKDIDRQRETVNEMSSQINGMAEEASAQIKEEQRKATEAIEKCAEGLAKLSTKINELNEKISDLNSKLSTIPPKIKKTYVDEDGKEYTVEEDNPEYINLQNQIVLLQNQLQQLMNLSNQIEGIKQQLSNQSEMLGAGIEQISQINSSIMGCNNSIGGLSSEAVGKLGQIQGVLELYRSESIGAPSLASIGRKGVSVWENIVPSTPALDDTPKSAMQKMADYMRKHDYGMGDKDKYMQDPEWIALNGALQEEIKEQERIMEERMDVRTPTNPNGLMYHGPYDDGNTPSSDGPSGVGAFAPPPPNGSGFAPPPPPPPSGSGFTPPPSPPAGGSSSTPPPRKGSLLAWLGIASALCGYGITYSLPDVKAYDPNPFKSEAILFKGEASDSKEPVMAVIEENNSSQAYLKFYGESAIELAEAIAEKLEHDEELAEAIRLVENDDGTGTITFDLFKLPEFGDAKKQKHVKVENE